MKISDLLKKENKYYYDLFRMYPINKKQAKNIKHNLGNENESLTLDINFSNLHKGANMMTEIDGVKIKITANVDGLDKDLKTSKKTIKEFGMSVDKNIGDKTEESSKRARRQMRKAFSITASSPLMNAIGKFGLKATAAFVAVATSIGYAGKELGEALDQFANLDLTSQQMEKFKAMAIEMSTQLAFSVEEISSVMASLHKTFGLTGEELKNMTELMLKFTKLTGTDTSQAMLALEKIMNGTGQSLDEVSKYLEMTNKLSQKIDNFDGAAFLDFLGENSVLMKDLNENQIKDMISLYATLTKNGIDTAGMQSLLNKAYEDALATGEDVTDVFQRYMDALQNADGSNREFIKLAEILGVSITELQEIINATNGDLDAFKDIFDGVGNSINDNYEKLNPLNKQ